MARLVIKGMSRILRYLFLHNVGKYFELCNFEVTCRRRFIVPVVQRKNVFERHLSYIIPNFTKATTVLLLEYSVCYKYSDF